MTVLQILTVKKQLPVTKEKTELPLIHQRTEQEIECTNFNISSIYLHSCMCNKYRHYINIVTFCKLRNFSMHVCITQVSSANPGSSSAPYKHSPQYNPASLQCSACSNLVIRFLSMEVGWLFGPSHY